MCSLRGDCASVVRSPLRNGNLCVCRIKEKINKRKCSALFLHVPAERGRRSRFCLAIARGASAPHPGDAELWANWPPCGTRAKSSLCLWIPPPPPPPPRQSPPCTSVGWGVGEQDGRCPLRRVASELDRSASFSMGCRGQHAQADVHAREDLRRRAGGAGGGRRCVRRRPADPRSESDP